MDLLLTNTHAYSKTKIENNIKSIAFYYAIYTALALFSTFNFIFSIFNFLYCLYLLFAKKKSFLVPFMIYATFFASLFKIRQISEMSLLTIIMLIFVVRNILTIKKIDFRFLILFLSFFSLAMIAQAINGNFDFNRNVKFFEVYIYIYFVVQSVSYDKLSSNGYSYKEIFFSFIFGVFVSSCFRFLDGSFFNISSFVEQKESTLGIGSIIYTRFSGLYGDPNYYAINPIIAMCLVVYLYAKNDLSKFFTTTMFTVFAVFAMMTRSKSALLIIVVPIFSLLYASKKRRDYKFLIVWLLLIVSIILLALSGKIPLINTIVNRFQEDTDVNSLTTGRIEIWSSYLEYFKLNPINTIIGNGLSSPILNVGGTHNTYLDIIYYIGIFPGLLFALLIFDLKNINKNFFRRNFLNYSIMIVVAVMYFFLGCLFDIDLCTNIIVIIVAYNTNTNKILIKKRGIKDGI